MGICAGDAKTFTGAERFWGELLQDISGVLKNELLQDGSSYLLN